MTAAVFAGDWPGTGARRLGYREPRSGYEMVVTTPASDPRWWQDFLAGAVSSYRAHGVEHALGLEEMRDGRSTSLLMVALDADRRVIGGIRTQGPYTEPDQAHAVEEWEGHPGQAEVRARVAAWLPDGVVEMKAAWAADDVPDRRELVECLCRTPFHAATVLGARYSMGTAAAHIVPGWTRAGGVVAIDVPPVPYPDERYRTSLVCFDVTALSDSMTDRERAAMDDESAQLRGPRLPVRGSR